jgi:hypothetical protein
MKTNAHTRYKTKDGSIVPGVTTVLGLHAKPALIRWANNLGLKGIDSSKFVDDKADIGTFAHAMVTNKLLDQPTDSTDYSANQISLAENCVLSFWEWEKRNKIKEVYFCERPLVSEKYRYGGTLDIYANIDDCKKIIDLKTGSGIYEEHIWQVATLKKLLEENGFQVDATHILNIPRSETESFLEKPVSNKENEIGFEIFLSLLNVYNLKKKMKGE